jgi:hypothetical protein
MLFDRKGKNFGRLFVLLSMIDSAYGDEVEALLIRVADKKSPGGTAGGRAVGRGEDRAGLYDRADLEVRDLSDDENEKENKNENQKGQNHNRNRKVLNLK